MDTRRTRFERLAPEVIDAVRRYLARRTDPATADDVLSETLLVCWRRLDEIPEEHLPWAYGVARNCLANAERGYRRQFRLLSRLARLDPPPSQTVDGPEQTVDGPETEDDDLTQAMKELTVKDAEILRLWAWEDLPPAQIATVMGITANAASIRLHRAKQKLRDALEKNRKNGDRAGHEQPTERRRS
ncbi:RNA polymerase sigma factor [Actinoplanes couchii]|uniref:RNA polymerase sigma factor n=1 Tax=Actinoplanes couchii TaxID=403638 RepID=UPI001EF3B9B3|nr:sigma-70 family RNA polymerase sigma factor [Actinoplanes couchii]MDR6322124.1 RNA polymerase sigma-70 factor (ECF subfamily) [Actinoplanes couchii]